MITKQKIKYVLLEALFYVALLFLGVAINTFILVNASVPSGSMESTIMTGSRVMGLRLAYVLGEPQRGDVVVFKFGQICKNCGVHVEDTDTKICTFCEKELKGSKTLHYVKRLIGVPGDHIEIKGDPLRGATVYINGEAIDEPYINNGVMDYDNYYEFDVPEGEYFFLGDNRNDSVDSRYWHDPYITRDELEGKAYIVYFPKVSYIG